jgi:hypothetical protein
MKCSDLLYRLFDIKYKNKTLCVYFYKYNDGKALYVSEYHKPTTTHFRKDVKFIKLWMKNINIKQVKH